MASRAYAWIRTAFLAFAIMTGSIAALGIVSTITSAVEPGKREPLTVVTDKGKTQFQVEIADTDATREEGLMFRPSVPADEGMLFDFKTTQVVYFWMKNTYASLDMIFIRDDGTVARIADHTTPLSEKTVPSGDPVRFVLEVAAGTADNIDLKPGDKVLNRLMKSSAE